MDNIQKGTFGNADILNAFIDKNTISGGSAGNTGIDSMIGQASQWLATEDKSQAAENLVKLMKDQPFDLALLQQQLARIRPVLGLGFQEAYRKGYVWAVANNNREDNVLYTKASDARNPKFLVFYDRNSGVRH